MAKIDSDIIEIPEEAMEEARKAVEGNSAAGIAHTTSSHAKHDSEEKPVNGTSAEEEPDEVMADDKATGKGKADATAQEKAATKEKAAAKGKTSARRNAAAKEEAAEEASDESALRRLKEKVSDDDTMPLSAMTLRKILGGDILTANLVRQQIWLYLLIMMFLVVYVAFRYQCQQDMITIDKLETELKDAKYRALSSNSTLTEKCRESHILERLKNDNDSLLHISDQPPYIINVPEDGE
jgi:chromatin remodeling complex protein RSC6